MMHVANYFGQGNQINFPDSDFQLPGELLRARPEADGSDILFILVKGARHAGILATTAVLFNPFTD